MGDPAAGKVSEKEPFPWHRGVFDAHCHPTDTIASQDHVPRMKARALTIMATRGEDQDLVKQFANKYGVKQDTVRALSCDADNKSSTQLVPSFGWHPWFSHQIFDDLSSPSCEIDAVRHYQAVLIPSPDEEFISHLPKPRPLSGLLDSLRDSLKNFPCALIGEIGIDRSFRLPNHWTANDEAKRKEGLTPGGREGRRLTPYRVQIDHQRKVLKAQLHLAGELRRPVSVHGVAAHGIVFETLKETWQGHEKEVLSRRERKRRTSAAIAHTYQATDDKNGQGDEPNPKPYPPRICLHSYSGPSDALKQYLDNSTPATIYFSFSRLVNFSNRSQKAVDAVKGVPDDRILIESDLHSAGDEMDRLLEEITRLVCEIKRWSLIEGVERLAGNWRRFVFGEQSAYLANSC
ncbi:MAG: hypothetical protein LQ346_004809 [Caloplaca aetnensis]|nr:MAG: hypothetical protein LQ346_004809 [Caloplaca aetnensis]